MQALPHLQKLNGLEVDREEDGDEDFAHMGPGTDEEYDQNQLRINHNTDGDTAGEDGNESDEAHEVDEAGHLLPRGAVKEYPELEDQQSAADGNY